MIDRLPFFAFASGFLVVFAAGLIVSGYTPRQEDLTIVLPFLAGIVATLVGVAVWRSQ